MAPLWAIPLIVAGGVAMMAGWNWYFGLWPFRSQDSPSSVWARPIATHPSIEPHLLRIVRALNRLLTR